jgi:hypothetical protein
MVVMILVVVLGVSEGWAKKGRGVATGNESVEEILKMALLAVHVLN